MNVPLLDLKEQNATLRPEIEAALAQFRGNLMQKPPAFSAIKQAGKTAYQQARKGHEIELEARPVTLYQLELLEFRPPAALRLAIHCSTGTYIRSLAYDLGIALGTVGVLTHLRRLTVGPFTLEQAHTLEEIQAKAEAGEIAQWLLPSGYGLTLPLLRLDGLATRRFGFGQHVKLPLGWTIANERDDSPAMLPEAIHKGMLAHRG